MSTIKATTDTGATIIHFPAPTGMPTLSRVDGRLAEVTRLPGYRNLDPDPERRAYITGYMDAYIKIYGEPAHH